MRHASAVVALTATLCACSSGPIAGSSSTSPNASAKTVVIQAADVQGMNKCPQSDDWARFLLSDQPNGPATVPPKFRITADMRAAGATEGWLSLYGEKMSDCTQYGSAFPVGRMFYSAAMKFTDASSAASSYEFDSQGFPVDRGQAENDALANGTLVKGAATGFGANSTVLKLPDKSFATTYIAIWQKASFEAVLWGLNVSASDGDEAAFRMNGRMN